MEYDAIVVGARVAGAIIAAMLARRGYRLLLLDRAHFPSDTLSTHFFRAPAMRVYEELGVLDAVKAAAPALRYTWNYIDGHVFQEPVEAPEEDLRFYLCERRVTLDAILFERARQEPGVEVHEGAHVQSLIRSDGHVRGVRWREGGQSHEAQARVVIGADGIYSTLAKDLNPPIETSYPVRRCMYYTYFKGIEPLDQPSAEHHFVGDSLTYVFPTDNGLTLVALSLPISEFAGFRKEPLERLRAHMQSLPKLAPRLRTSEMVAEVKGAGNIPGYQRIPYGRGWVLVGDSHQVMDPWSGMGIDHATTHAAFLSRVLDDWLQEATSWENAMQTYHQQARAWSEKAYHRTSTHAADLRPMTRAALQRRGLA